MSILDLLNDELAKVRQDIQDAKKHESDILKAIEAIKANNQEIEVGDTVSVLSIDKTKERYYYTKGMYCVDDEFIVRGISQDSHGRKRAHDCDNHVYALEDLKLIEKNS